jgi:hypothetical protein
MEHPVVLRFDTQREFGVHVRACIAHARVSLQMVDPDFGVFPLGMADVDAALRQFLAGGGTIELAMHRCAHIERHAPRLLRLLRDFGHRIACRATPASLHTLSDSFCIGDQAHIVRRFHSDHLRGEAAFGNPPATEISLARFKALWLESRPCLHPGTTGL